MGLHRALGTRYYGMTCPYCGYHIYAGDETFTDAYGGEVYHPLCWEDLQHEIAIERGEDDFGDFVP